MLFNVQLYQMNMIFSYVKTCIRYIAGCIGCNYLSNGHIFLNEIFIYIFEDSQIIYSCHYGQFVSMKKIYCLASLVSHRCQDNWFKIRIGTLSFELFSYNAKWGTQ